jgi:hypothetical protein
MPATTPWCAPAPPTSPATTSTSCPGAALLGRGCVAGVTAVPPERAHNCRIYVTCVSGAGAEVCMVAGGVAVVGPGRPGLVADGVNGIVASADPSRATEALRRAQWCDADGVGREARRVALLNGEDTFRWARRHTFRLRDPLATLERRDAVHVRFLLLACT